jgi:hypothetical protein
LGFALSQLNVNRSIPVTDRADNLLADLLSIICDNLTGTLRSQMLDRLRDEFDAARAEGFQQALEMRHDADD